MKKGIKNRMITIPNILTFFRILLIPVFVWLYLGKEANHLAGFVIIISGITDLVDGYIARKYNMVSDFGKALDPVADKLTQVTIIACLIIKYPFMIVLIITLVVKETISGITSLIVLKRIGHMMYAKWHGKVVTFLLYSVILIHIFLKYISPIISYITIGVCVVMMITSLILYGIEKYNILKEFKNKQAK